MKYLVSGANKLVRSPLTTSNIRLTLLDDTLSRGFDHLLPPFVPAIFPLGAAPLFFGSRGPSFTFFFLDSLFIQGRFIRVPLLLVSFFCMIASEALALALFIRLPLRFL